MNLSAMEQNTNGSLPNNNSSQSLPKAQSTSSVAKTNRLPVVGRQANLKEISQWFSTTHLSHYSAQPRKCYFEQVPTLYDLNRTFGPGTAQQWLVPFLIYINGAVTAERKMNDFQMASCAMTIVNNYGYLKLTEIMLFVSRLLGGTYGKVFFNAVDPMAITNALHDGFLPQRNAAYDNYQSHRVVKDPPSSLSKSPEEISNIIQRVKSKVNKQ